MSDAPTRPDDDVLARVFTSQAQVCAQFGSAFYGVFARLVGEGLDEAVRALFKPWAGLSYEALFNAAVTLRFLGAAHDLALSGDDPAVTAAFPPTGDPAAAWAATRAAIGRDPARFAAFMTHEPQTNEVRRSACLLPGFLTIATATSLPLACLELGASAGLNQLWSRFHYDYGAAGAWGDPASPLALTAAWSGAEPPRALWDAPLTVASSRACDRSPIDIADPAQRRRLKAYLWPDQTERVERFDIAARMAVGAGVRVEAADAAAWAEAHAAPRDGVTTTVFHSIFWQYLPDEVAERITAAMAAHGAKATKAAPLAWLRMEPAPGQVMPIELRLTLWPGGEERRLAVVQAHGATVAWDGAQAG